MDELQPHMPTDGPSSLHLILPLLSSILFVIGAMFGKAAAVRGANPYTNTVAANLCLGVFWAVFGPFWGPLVSLDALGPVVGMACAFVLGQLLTYLAFQYGDVSLATPIFGIKIILVAIFSSLLLEHPIPLRIWVAAILASIGVGIVQAGSGSSPKGKASASRAVLTVVLALLAATSYSVFDVGMQIWGKKYGAESFLTAVFVLVGIISCVFIPWTNKLSQLRQNQAIVPVLLTGLIIAGQAMIVSYALGKFGDATRINIVYSLRGLWSVVLAWLLNRLAANPEGWHSNRTMLIRLTGAAILLLCIIIAMT